MLRYAIIDIVAKKVVNVVEYDIAPSNPPPGFDAGIIAVQSDAANPEWGWSGTALVPPPPAPVTPFPQTVLPQDLMAQFTADDAAKIQAAVSSNSLFWLLWSAMQAQKDPMHITNERFQAGWAALVQVLGQPRMATIATALDLAI
jgi:hypothetical protein